MNKKIILLANGQTCNRFWQYSSVIADCIEKGNKMYILNPDISLELYENLYSSNIINFPFYFKFVKDIFGYKTVIRILDICFRNRISVRLMKIVSQIFPNIIVLNTGVGYKSPYREKHKEIITKLFKPNDKLINTVDEEFHLYLKSFDLVVGVHIRHGDYKYYKEGKYFYDFKDYNNKMQEFQSLFNDKRIIFFISSNSLLDISFFKDVNCFKLSKTDSAMADLYGLSKCSYIFGPPSTFSAWASFMSDVPINFLDNINDEIKVDSFDIISNIYNL